MERRINYLDNIEPGEKINLESKKEKGLNYEKLNQVLYKILENRSTLYNNYYGLDWLSPDCSIKINESQPDFQKDQDLVRAQEEGFARGLSLKEWRAKRDLNPASIAEKLLTLAWQDILPERFVVVASSSYDDYNNGIDKLIIDSSSGAIICGIDELIEPDKPQFSKNKKEDKLKRKILSGGARLKYGASILDNKLSLVSLKNIPAFYFPLKKSELSRLAKYYLEKTSEDKQDRLSSNMDWLGLKEDLLSSLKESLKKQLASYKDLELNPILLKQLNNIAKVLEEI